MDRRTTHYFVRTVLPATALLALGGCNSTGLGAPTASELALGCPRVSIIRELKTVTEFRPGAGRDVSDIVARGELVDYKGNCEYGSDGVTVNLSLLLGAEKGPAMTGNQAAFRYFVAVLRPDETKPVAKAEFDTQLVFRDGQTRAANNEEVTPRIPVPKDTNVKNWSVVVGFQLTEAQRDYNLTQIAKARAAQ